MLGLIEEALEAAERQAGEASPEPEEQPREEAGTGPCEIQSDGDASHSSQDSVEPWEDEEGLPGSQDE